MMLLKIMNKLLINRILTNMSNVSFTQVSRPNAVFKAALVRLETSLRNTDWHWRHLWTACWPGSGSWRFKAVNQVLHGIWRYSSLKPRWPSPKALVGAGGETKSTSWKSRELKYRCLIICRQSLIEVEENLSNNDASSSVLFNEESRFFLHLQCESCSRSRGRKGRGRGRSRCQRWESLCLQSHCWW